MSAKRPNRKFTPPAPEDVPAAVTAAAPAADEPRVLHVNGKPVPPEWEHAIVYAMTDEGQAEARGRDRARGMTPSGVKVTADTFDKQLQRKANAEVWDSFDPLKEAVDQVREPGFSYRALSPRVVDKRGMRGWEKVLDKDGRDVKVANLFVARMPEERKEQRNAHYREIGEEALRDAAEQYEEGQAKLVKDAKVGGLAPLRVGDRVRDSEDPDFGFQVGVSTHRGMPAGADA